jgi:hypothetical protein
MLQGNQVGGGHPVGLAQFYGWDPVNQEFGLFTPGALLSVTGKTLNVATESVAQYGWGTVVPESCSHVGTLYFDTDAPGGGKLYYCNGLNYESVQPGAAGGLGDPSENGLVKRIGAFVTAAAVAGVDYYAPGMAISPADLPMPSQQQGGLVRARTCGTSEFLSSINSDGTVTCLQGATGARLMDPGASGLVKRTTPEMSVVAQPGVDYYVPGMAISPSDLPAPSATAGGAVRAKACPAGEFLSSINSDGTANCLPAVTGAPRLIDPGVNGLVKRTGVEATTAAVPGLDYYAPGSVVASADLPNPSASEGGKVRARTCAAGEFLSAISPDSTVTCGAPQMDHKITEPDTAGGGLKYLRRNAGNTAWEISDVEVPLSFRGNLREASGVVDWDFTDASTVFFGDEFTSGGYSAGSYSGSSMFWTVNAIGTSTASAGKATPSWPNIGILRISTAAVTAGNGNYIMPNGATADPYAYGANTSNVWRAAYVFRLAQNVDSRFYIGMTYAANSLENNGFGLRWDTSAAAKCGGADTANFKFYSINYTGASHACVDSGVPADTAFHTLIIESDAAHGGSSNGKVWFRLDAGTWRSICSTGCDATGNITTAGLIPLAAQIVSNSTSATVHSMEIDKLALQLRVGANKDRRN